MAFVRSAGILAAGVAAAAIAACAQQVAPPARSAAAGDGKCFLPSQVNGFNAIDDNTVQVFVGARDVYTLDLLGPCTNVDWATQIAIRPTGGGSWVCSGLDAELLVPSPGMGTQRCLVTNIQQLSPDAAKAARTGRGS